MNRKNLHQKLVSLGKQMVQHTDLNEKTVNYNFLIKLAISTQHASLKQDTE